MDIEPVASPGITKSIAGIIAEIERISFIEQHPVHKRLCWLHISSGLRRYLLRDVPRFSVPDFYQEPAWVGSSQNSGHFTAASKCNFFELANRSGLVQALFASC